MCTLEQYPNKTVNRLLTCFYTLKVELGPIIEINYIQTLDTTVYLDIQDQIAYQEAPTTLLEQILKATCIEHLLLRVKKSSQNQNKDKDTLTPRGLKDKNTSTNQGSKLEGLRTYRGSLSLGFQCKKKEDQWRNKARNSNNSSRGKSSLKPTRSIPRGPVYQTYNKLGHFSRDPKYKKYNKQKKQQKDKAPSTRLKGT